MLIENKRGGYSFLKGISPYSAGAVAHTGFAIEHARLRAPIAVAAGFAAIDAYLKSLSRPRTALCGIELRSPQPFTFQGFSDFNAGYVGILKSWDLLQDGLNPIARTNVAPELGPPSRACSVFPTPSFQRTQNPRLLSLEHQSRQGSRGQGARRHLVSSDTPFRLERIPCGPDLPSGPYAGVPLFREPQYVLSLANKLVQVGPRIQPRHRPCTLRDPHATAAFCAAGPRIQAADGARVVTTLHGTDITLVGNDPSYLGNYCRFRIEQSDGVTAVSQQPARVRRRELAVQREITVIPNFLDCTSFVVVDVPNICAAAFPAKEKPRS